MLNNFSDTVINFTCPLFENQLFHKPPSHEEKTFFLLMITINAIMAAVASCSNALVIYTISRTPSLQTPSNILVLGLAVSDFCVGIFVQPSYCFFRYGEFSRNIDVFCRCSQVYVTSCVMLLAISIATLTSITADRFLAVHLHLRYQELITPKRYGILLVAIWATGITLTILSFFELGPGLVTACLVIFGALFVMNAYFLWKVFRVIRRHSVQIQAQQSAVTSMKRRKKSVYTMYSMIGAFLMCYIPYVGVAIKHRVDETLTEHTRSSIIVTETLFMFNGVLNPVIYFWRIEDMKDAAIHLLMKLYLQRKENLSEPIQNT